MSSTVLRFELLIPFAVDPLIQPAIDAFYTGLAALTTSYVRMQVYQPSLPPPGNALVFGLLTSGQVSTALTLLNTLNSALTSPPNPAVPLPPVTCYTWNVATQP